MKDGPSDKTEQDVDGAEDTEAILSRRAFLIRSGLATAGVAAAGCGERRPEPCLKTRSRPCLSVDTAPRRDARVPRPCLEVAKRRDAGAPQPCLKVKPPPPQPCLSPRPCLKVKPPAPQPCLSQPPPPRKP